ncbi:putative AC transposase [Purpureocillium lavendulum]|uniref:tyrosine--tRNA ligase n=1 Tax=Purpureocillium lavendulum TaxID=1247861 RepID=A0AB34FDW0_9HYPO|nr:putative AC transposase [Purpureocillium lavendulum]
MSTDGTTHTAFHAITSRLETINPNRLLEKLRSGCKVKGYWGTAPTGKPHIGYLVPLIKVAECISAGVEVVILIADSYAFLINHDVSMDVVEFRAQYYALLLAAVLRALGVPQSKICIQRESAFSMTAEHCKDKMRLCAASTQDEIRAVGIEVNTASMISPLLCPIHQALCDVYLGCDFQLGGFDQRGAFLYANRTLPRIGYEPITYLMAAMIPGLKSGKMSSSAQDDTKITFTDPDYLVSSKIAAADGGTASTGSKATLAMFQHVVFPAHAIGVTAGSVQITSSDGTSKTYGCYERLQDDIAGGLVDEISLQSALARELNAILDPVRREHAASETWQLVEQLAYYGASDNAQAH